jgi:hypothetical protein
MVEFPGDAGSDALETLIVTPDQAGKERVSRSRPAGRISPSGQGRDIRQLDEQLAGFIERIRTRPGDGRTGWPSHCSPHIGGLLLYRQHTNT